MNNNQINKLLDNCKERAARANSYMQTQPYKAVIEVHKLNNLLYKLNKEMQKW
jgi:hypothetical protein